MNMRYLRRFLSVVCVCLSVLFSSSLIAYADDVIEQFNDDFLMSTEFVWGSRFQILSTARPITNNFTDNFTSNDIEGSTPPVNGSLTFTFNKSNGKKIFNKESNVDITITDLIIQLEELELGYGTTNYNQFIIFGIYVYDVNGNKQWLDRDSYSFTSKSFNVKVKDLPFDVYKFGVVVNYQFNYAFTDFSGKSFSSAFTPDACFNLHLQFDDTDFFFVENQYTDTEGLLDTIIEYIKAIPNNIANAIEGFFDRIVSALDTLKSSIEVALQTLGNMILDGLKELFLPSQDDILEMQSKWEELLADRFGAIYQAVTLIFDYVEVFQDREQGTVEFPTIKIPLGETDFEFGGYTVKVVPDGFSLLIDALKLVISVSCTVLFVNTLKRKYDKLVEG